MTAPTETPATIAANRQTFEPIDHVRRKLLTWPQWP